ncbi:MAG: hypothetical protein Tsb0021_05030 [Chlamydiales bacterium]
MDLLINSDSENYRKFFKHVSPPLAASIAIIPTFYGFALKSARQLGDTSFHLTYRQSIKEGVKAAPINGIIVGTQLIAQNFLEGQFEKDNHASIVISSLIVGGVSAPAYAIFNGQTMGKTARESLKNFSKYQALSIMFRETCFLFSLRISGPLNQKFKESYGENKVIKVATIFFTGSFGGIMTHPLDTYLTCLQKNVKVENVSHSLRGIIPRSFTVGSFAVCYNLLKEFFDLIVK